MKDFQYKFRLKKLQSLMAKKDKAWGKLSNYSGSGAQDFTTDYSGSSSSISDLDYYDAKMIKKLKVFEAAGYDVSDIIHKDIIGKVKCSDSRLYDGLLEYAESQKKGKTM